MMKEIISGVLRKLGLVSVSRLDLLEHNCDVLRRQRAALREQNRVLRDRMKQPSIWMQRTAKGENFWASYFDEFSGMKSGYRACLRSFVHSIEQAGEELCSAEIFSKLADAQFMHSERFYKRTLQILENLPREIVLRYIPYVYLDCLAHEDRLEIEVLNDLIRKNIEEGKVDEALKYIELFAKARKFDLFYEKIDQLDNYELVDKQTQNKVLWYKNFKWESEKDAGGEYGSVNLGILDYKNLDMERASNNIGDWVQTLSLISNLAREQNVCYVSEDKALADFVNSCKEKISKVDQVTEASNVTVNLVKINRDFSNNQQLPEKTWTFVFGWYMHHNFGTWYDFPLNKNILPIFISFHLNRKSILSDDAVSYLKQFEPIGCRDWTTVDILSSRGIKAFFSGCVTSTIGQLYDCSRNRGNGRVANVESKTELVTDKGVDFFSNVSPVFKQQTLVENLKASYDTLNKYREYDEIYTSRLHCYLPMRSLGKHPNFTNQNLSDPRFEGLISISDQEFLGMATSLKQKILKIYEVILLGNSREDVYKYWQKLCEDDVKLAKEYISKNIIVPRIENFNLETVVNELKQKCSIFNAQSSADVNLAFAVDKNQFQYLAVVLESIVHNTNAKLNVVLLLRKVTAKDVEELAVMFKEVQFTVYYCDSVEYGEDLSLLKHITVSTMDRLLLPVVCDNLAKILYLDVDIIVTGDIAELYGIDVTAYRYAGKHSDHPGWVSCDALVSRAALHCSKEKAAKLRNTAYHMGRLDFRAANAGVTLMNLEKMRKEGFVQKFVPLVEQYQLNDQDALNLYSQGNRLEIDSCWNVYATQESIQEAKLIHFAGPNKPWGELYVRGKEVFCHYQDSLRNRLKNK